MSDKIVDGIVKKMYGTGDSEWTTVDDAMDALKEAESLPIPQKYAAWQNILNRVADTSYRQGAGYEDGDE